MKAANHLLCLILLLAPASISLVAQDKLVLKEGLEVLGSFDRIKNQKVHFQRHSGGGRLKVRLDKIETIVFEAGRGRWFTADNPYIFAKPKLFGVNYYILDQRIERKNFFTALAPYPETRSKIILGRSLRIVGSGLTITFVFIGIATASDGGLPLLQAIGTIALFSSVVYLIGGSVNLAGKRIMLRSTDNFNNSRLQTENPVELYFGMVDSGLGVKLNF